MITEGFVDGDLVERFLDLSQTQMDEVCKGLKVGGKIMQRRQFGVVAHCLTVLIQNNG